ncbi:MAG TPA: WYL domain-containing protein [Campylobacterales bacterium]|nr:WYL domain-containing protein [Campylobacterales bacterium]
MRVIYQLHSSPFEEIKDQKIWHTLKEAIRNKRYICIAYHESKLLSYSHVKPIKIVYAKNNWYLATIISEEDKHGYGFTFLRINHIIGVSMETQNFQEDISALKFLENFQTLFEEYRGKSYTVNLLAKKEIAVFFKQKKYLKSQSIVDTQEDGSLLLSFRIDNSLEIMPLIKQWLPHLIVVQPQTLKEEIDKILHQYLDR